MPRKSYFIRAGVALHFSSVNMQKAPKAPESSDGLRFIPTVNVSNNADNDIVMYFLDKKKNEESNIYRYF